MIKQFLTNQGFNLVYVHYGETALKIFQEESFDIMLLDIMIPKLDGLNVMQRIREISTIPIIVEIKVKQVTKMIEEFFTITKLQSEDYPITNSCVYCNEICKSSIVGFYDILSEKGFNVDINIPEHDILAYADKESIERIFYNLFSKLNKY